MKQILSWYWPTFGRSLVYMLQASEYKLNDYIAWFWKARDVRTVAVRKKLALTAKAKLLLFVTYSIIALEAVALFVLVYIGLWPYALALFIGAPFVTVYGLAFALWAGQIFIQKPREKRIIARAKIALAAHNAYKIGIAGSFGKTTYKEMLATMLSAGKNTAATPGNMNTPLGISRFAAKLTGDEEVLIFEMGEYYPGDIAQLCDLTNPDIGIITGVNEAHLSRFKTIDRTVATIFEIADYIGDPKHVYKNGESELVRQKAGNDKLIYTRRGVNGWKVSGVQSGMDGLRFIARKGQKVVRAHSQLIGAHNVGPLVACIDIADRLGLRIREIEEGIAATKAFEHRMQPKKVGGAWIIDDTYNGNSDGVRAGIAWLASVEAKRRMYVTPGLVEQGSKTAEVHQAIGEQLASVADIVVLMRNSTTSFIEQGLQKGGFIGKLQIIDDPLAFYTNIEHMVAAGDVVLMQNDWTDNYA
jgi:UDP-N-acetylmuramoyl-tripeptide--D-alanyl-D-alanine ligase